MRIDVVTLFPELFESPLQLGLVGKSIAAGRAEIGFVELRSFAEDRHRTVDDEPYGGGAGMVMKPEPLRRAIEHARSRSAGGGHVVMLTPQGRPLSQADLSRYAAMPHLILVAGRYEGFDERARRFADEEVSLGDFVMTGGEIAALAIIDGVVRLLPGTVGNEASIEHDSFSAGLLEHAQYTRPPELDGHRVPEVLLGGDHAKIARARQADALARTRRLRPELLARRGFDEEARAMLEATASALPPISVVIAVKPSALAIDPWVRLVAAYGIEQWIAVPADETDPVSFAVRFEAARASAPPPPPLVVQRGASRKRQAQRLEAERRALERLSQAKERVLARGSAALAVEELKRARPELLVVRAALSPPPEAVRSPAWVRAAAAGRGLVLVLSDAELPVEAGADALSEAIAPAGGFIPPITGQDALSEAIAPAGGFIPPITGQGALSEAIAPAGGFIQPITGQDVYLPVVRVASRYRRLGPVVGPAVLLDRLLGEG